MNTLPADIVSFASMTTVLSAGPWCSHFGISSPRMNTASIRGPNCISSQMATPVASQIGARLSPWFAVQ